MRVGSPVQSQKLEEFVGRESFPPDGLGGRGAAIRQNSPWRKFFALFKGEGFLTGTESVFVPGEPDAISAAGFVIPVMLRGNRKGNLGRSTNWRRRCPGWEAITWC
jgi:hypothetical protein